MRKAVLAIVAVSAALFVASGAVADYRSSWYSALRRPSWLVFERYIPFIWVAIYVCSTLSAIRTHQHVRRRADRRAILALFLANAVAHFSFSVLFTRLHSLLGAVIDGRIIASTIIGVTALQWRHDRLAALLNLPYVVWSFVASIVVTALYALNRRSERTPIMEHVGSLPDLP